MLQYPLQPQPGDLSAPFFHQPGFFGTLKKPALLKGDKTQKTQPPLLNKRQHPLAHLGVEQAKTAK